MRIFLPKFGLDAAEIDPLEVWGVLIQPRNSNLSAAIFASQSLNLERRYVDRLFQLACWLAVKQVLCRRPAERCERSRLWRIHCRPPKIVLTALRNSSFAMNRIRSPHPTHLVLSHLPSFWLTRGPSPEVDFFWISKRPPSPRRHLLGGN